jgi:hypothetical protein
MKFTQMAIKSSRSMSKTVRHLFPASTAFLPFEWGAGESSSRPGPGAFRGASPLGGHWRPACGKMFARSGGTWRGERAPLWRSSERPFL